MFPKTPGFKHFNRAGVAALVILLGGCSTHYGAARLTSTPSGVSVIDLEDGSVIGVTPVNHVWRSKDAKKKYMNLQVHKVGYQDAVKTFWLSLPYGSAEDAAQNPQSVQFDLNQSTQ